MAELESLRKMLADMTSLFTDARWKMRLFIFCCVLAGYLLGKLT